MALGRPPIVWKSFPVSGKEMSSSEAAKFLDMQLNTLHQQLFRDRGLAVTDGHAVKVNGEWRIRESIKNAFLQKESFEE